MSLSTAPGVPGRQVLAGTATPGTGEEPGGESPDGNAALPGSHPKLVMPSHKLLVVWLGDADTHHTGLRGQWLLCKQTQPLHGLGTGV